MASAPRPPGAVAGPVRPRAACGLWRGGILRLSGRPLSPCARGNRGGACASAGSVDRSVSWVVTLAESVIAARAAKERLPNRGARPRQADEMVGSVSV